MSARTVFNKKNKDLMRQKFYPFFIKTFLCCFVDSLIMSRCSVVLKSLTATLMHHFESSREKTAQNSPKQLECACHVVRCLAKVSHKEFISSSAPCKPWQVSKVQIRWLVYTHLYNTINCNMVLDYR